MTHPANSKAPTVKAGEWLTALAMTHPGNSKAPTGRTIPAQGKEPRAAALGPPPPQIPSPEGTGQMPVGWVNVGLTGVGVAITGNTPSTNDADNYGRDVPFVKPPDLENRVIAKPKSFLSDRGAAMARTLPPMCVLVTCIGNLGRVGINRVRVAFNQQINAVVPNESIYPVFLFYVAQSNAFRTQLESLASATTIAIVNKGNFEKITIPLPPLAEQRRIVAKIEELFSKLDAGEESLRKARRQLGVYRQSLLKQAFEGKLTEGWRKQNPQLLESPDQLLVRIQAERQADYAKQLRAWEEAKRKQKKASRPSEPKLMENLTATGVARLDPPEGWATERIGNCPTDSLIGLVRAATEQSADPSGVSYIKMDRVDMLGNVDLRADVFVTCTEEEITRFHLRQGDILFNTRNSVELVGKTAVLRRDPTVPTVYNNNMMRIRLPDCLHPTFVGLQLCAKPFRQRMEQVKKATTSVAAIYGKDFWPLPIVFPSLLEQQEIVRLLDSQFTVIEQNEHDIDTALKRSAALRQSILKKAFTGQLVAQDPTDEPASALLERIREERTTHTLPRKIAKKPAAGRMPRKA